MFGFEFTGFTEKQKGYLSLLFGGILLLNALNIFKGWFNGILILVAILLIVYGVIKAQLIEHGLSFLKKAEKASSKVLKD